MSVFDSVLDTIRDHIPDPDLWGAPKSDVVYLGINDEAKEKETAALPPGATVCDGSKKNGTIMAADGKTELDLRKEADVMKFLTEAGVGARRKKPDGSLETQDEADKRVDKLEEVFLGRLENGEVVGAMDVEARDEMAEFVQTMQKVENGEIDMKRLIISGHHFKNEQGIHGKGEKGVTYDQLNAITGQFTGARDGVEHLMLSACNTVEGYDEHDGVYKDMFPGLETAWGYHDIAPSVGPDKRNSSPAHIKAWEEVSRGGDADAIDAESKQRYVAKVAKY